MEGGVGKAERRRGRSDPAAPPGEPRGAAATSVRPADAGRRRAVPSAERLYGWLAPLSDDDLVPDAGRPDAPF